MDAGAPFSSAVLLRIEFTAMDALTRHWVSSYLAFPPLPRCAGRRCGAVYLCCTFPQIALGGRCPLSLPCGARTFLMRGLSALRPRLSGPVTAVFYPMRPEKSNALHFTGGADIIIQNIAEKEAWV